MKDLRFDPETGGFLLVDKPLTWTSFDVVGKIRIAIRIAAGRKMKVGHAGTLDPLATGLLILAYGKFTKQLPHITGHDKTYAGTLTLGSVTPSYDLETEPEQHHPWEQVDETMIRTAFAQFTGEFLQRPPNFSAKRFKGERAYWLARDEERAHLVELPPRSVRVDRLEVTAIRGAEVDFVVDVSKGTYIRSLAHDIGQALGCGAHLSALRRTRIGEFNVADSMTPEEWSERLAQEER
ncbi:MAG: tRNA pseudouridine(55) synthase TruB [Flavobacteriales bacterium]|nr:tRNA pseudouridine(55) synthase TruB [Flavobacteriales bacterium]MBK6550180.1 tRNA pseudouridine(55) synthase TruB [Flavobacteriales bacterium]MBK6881658.1 tRNA pseudouridine(55) synthase TruB [Flavobacteriales bacterium]MBK7103549.1 tRNA pseudouridine(55) synthase TruB [Flavobacteriales bacterium]MBK7113424.1 tRNA pseudouridine(55) synthase TruB [Flavobacteriales bacterium]